MKATNPMPLIIRCWLVMGRVFQGLVHLWARRRHSRQGIEQGRFGERMGIASVKPTQGRWVWVHASSLGEVSQTAQLVAALEGNGVNVLVTTVTQSGAHWVEQSLPNVVHQYLPLDTPTAVNNFLDTWSPELAIFIEADIWPRIVLEVAARQIPLTLVNARPSKSRGRAPKTYRYLLSHFCAITCKSDQVADGLRTLGVPTERLYSFGDLRASVPALSVDSGRLAALESAISDRPVWVAASSHADDETHIITACTHVLASHPDALLIWAPRHPERAEDILNAASEFVVQSRSKSETLTRETQIYLADTFGELGLLFSCSKIVFLGGSFGDEGGHNPYEPACFGCHLLTGPQFKNHQDAFAEFILLGAAETVADGAQLGHHVSTLMTSGTAKTSGAKARALINATDGAVAETAAVLLAHLPK